jgi:hypothetical protein
MFEIIKIKFFSVLFPILAIIIGLFFANKLGILEPTIKILLKR